MFRVLRRKTVIAIGVLALASFAGGAVAATTEASSPRAAFLSDLAARLHVTVPQLSNAIKGADLDALSRAVASGRLSAAEANVIRRRIKSGEAVPLGEVISARGHARARMFLFPLPGLGGRARLRAHKTLARIAAAHGKSVAGLERAILTAQRARLNRLVAAKLITRAEAHMLIARLRQRLATFVTSADPSER
ncbi:MAG TPA: hypothetical protein VMD48_06170 [Solirubrobacteraceae bacterium]|nr:hypothetical protein [Solirubrobacteraceae bacterium]